MSLVLTHAIILIVAVVGAFLLAKTLPPQYDIYVISLLFIIYYLQKHLFPEQKVYRLADSVIFTLIIMLIVFSSGGIESSLFFLTYFLIFALALLLEPIISITTTTAIVIVFLLTINLNTQDSIKSLIPLITLPFLVPFALFLGKEYRNNLLNSYEKMESFIFLSTVIKGHISKISEVTENFTGDQDLDHIKQITRRMEKLIEKYEESV